MLLVGGGHRNLWLPSGGGGGGWSCLNCSNKIIKKSLDFYRLKLLYFYKGRPLNFAVFIFARLSVKVILFWWFYCYNFYHADFDRKMIELSGFQMGLLSLLLPYFMSWSYFSLLFSKMFHYHYFITLKYHLHDKILIFFLDRFARSDFRYKPLYFLGSRLLNTSILNFYLKKSISFGLFVDEDHSKLPTLYWLPKLHIRPFKSRLIANSSACTTTESSILLTSCLTAIENHVIEYCTTVNERNGKKIFWSIKNSGEILNKLKSRGFLASGLSTYDISTLYTTLPHNLIKEKFTELIEQTFNREGSLYSARYDKNAFFTSERPKRYKLWSCQKCVMLSIIFWTIYL